MAIAYDWPTVAKFLASKGAQHVKTKGNMSAYFSPRTNGYIKVVKLGNSGYEYTSHASRAACGCD